MDKRKTHQNRLYGTVLYTAWCAALLMPAAALTGPHPWLKSGKFASLFKSTASGNAIVASSGSGNNKLTDVFSGQNAVLPAVLTPKDISLYKTIFAAQKSHDWKAADEAIGRLKNKLLLGHVLADRYLSPHHTNHADDLVAWLHEYNDHPQAANIYALALAKVPTLKREVAPVRKQATLSGYGDDNGMAVQNSNTPHATSWRNGLAAWKSGHKAEAAKHFASVVEHKDSISPWMASAAAFWAARSYSAIGSEAEAEHYLHLAAKHPRSFYGILARKQLRQPLGLDDSPLGLTESDVLEMIGDPTVRRVVALTQAGMSERAEKELRAAFPQADREEKPRLLALAHELGLASVQISMAKQLSSEDRGLDFARYPIPYWQPDGGFTIDPLLIFSVVRQESGFRASAANPSGATGLMQLMPKTASLMQKQLKTKKDKQGLTNPLEPITNVTLGQNYVQHLLTNNLIEGNLVYLLAAYNAGPGRLQEWKTSIQHNQDPLLFIESIPFAQTRHYVMQVMANYWIYSELTGQSNRSVYALLRGKWPSYDGYQELLADNKPASDRNPGA